MICENLMACSVVVYKSAWLRSSNYKIESDILTKVSMSLLKQKSEKGNISLMHKIFASKSDVYGCYPLIHINFKSSFGTYFIV